MSWITSTLSSSIGRKILMALTGLFLSTFLVVHLMGNLQLLYDDGGLAFNIYARFMSTNPLIQVVSKVNFALILVHVGIAIWLTIQNRNARPQAYQVAGKSSTWASRNMLFIGSVIFIFIGIHLANFWYVYHYGEVPVKQYVLEDGTKESIRNLYEVCMVAFQQPLLVLFYVLAQLALALHMYHGFESGFQTLGVNHPKWSPLVKLVSYAFIFLIPAGYAVIPVYFLLK